MLIIFIVLDQFHINFLQLLWNTWTTKKYNKIISYQQKYQDNVGAVPLFSCMMTSNGNIFCITGPFWRGFTSQQWIPLTEASDVELWWSLFICTQTNGWINNRDAGDLRHHHGHYDVIVMGKACITAHLLTVKRKVVENILKAFCPGSCLSIILLNRTPIMVYSQIQTEQK